MLDNFFKRTIFKSYKLENARNLVSKVLSLPMHPLLKEEDQDKIIDCLIYAIKSFVNEKITDYLKIYLQISIFN